MVESEAALGLIQAGSPLRLRAAMGGIKRSPQVGLELELIAVRPFTHPAMFRQGRCAWL